jgi:hypothetical protein
MLIRRLLVKTLGSSTVARAPSTIARAGSLAIATIITVVLSGPALAADIQLAFVAEGEALPIVNMPAGAAPANAAGGGDVASIMAAAAEVWELAILDEWSVPVRYGWSPLGGSTVAETHITYSISSPQRVLSATVVFDNDESSQWFMDPTPGSSSEFGPVTVAIADLGGGEMNTGRYYAAGTGDAAGLDLLTTAMHELGHVMGLNQHLDGFTADNIDGDLDISSPRPFAGAALATTGGDHLDLPYALMRSCASSGARCYPSAADIVAVAQVSQFTMVNISVPEPATVALLAAGLGVVMIRTAKRRSLPGCKSWRGRDSRLAALRETPNGGKG